MIWRTCTTKATLNPRVLIGAVIIKHTLNLDDRETIAHITENMYLKYFLGYSSKTPANHGSLPSS
ncbi:transposase [Cyclobacterium xiamenense]|uniref:transposase n=1 Tax=Cyclobacterium xiamenense TaxID=1297121 RepID=UPI001FCFD942|nr:transposase [Cyclobacterium xiamenense]